MGCRSLISSLHKGQPNGRQSSGQVLSTHVVYMAVVGMCVQYYFMLHAFGIRIQQVSEGASLETCIDGRRSIGTVVASGEVTGGAHPPPCSHPLISRRAVSRPCPGESEVFMVPACVYSIAFKRVF